jgi:hypothetical protein
MTVAESVDLGRSPRKRCAVGILLAVVLTQGANILMSAATGTIAVSSVQKSTKSGENSAISDDDLLWELENVKVKKKLKAFYNMFIPPSHETVSPVVRDLMLEQLTQMLESYAASAFDLVIHIVSLGHVVDDAWIENMCSSVITSSTTSNTFQCVLMAQYPDGDEVLTLSHLHDYCRANDSELVVYFHNKGSFHPSVSNDNLRRSLTAALSSDHCLTKMIKKDLGALSTCDTCSLLFDPLPGTHYPGNMWVARCSYIAKLLPLPDYQQRHQVVDNWIQDQTAKNIFVGPGAAILGFWENAVGRGRFESEHWMAGHPSMRPCDVATHASVDHWRPDSGVLKDFGPKSAHRFEWSVAPRFSYESPHWYYADWYVPDTRYPKRPAEQRRCDFFSLARLVVPENGVLQYRGPQRFLGVPVVSRRRLLAKFDCGSGPNRGHPRTVLQPIL